MHLLHILILAFMVAVSSTWAMNGRKKIHISTPSSSRRGSCDAADTSGGSAGNRSSVDHLRGSPRAPSDPGNKYTRFATPEESYTDMTKLYSTYVPLKKMTKEDIDAYLAKKASGSKR